MVANALFYSQKYMYNSIQKSKKDNIIDIKDAQVKVFYNSIDKLLEHISNAMNCLTKNKEERNLGNIYTIFTDIQIALEDVLFDYETCKQHLDSSYNRFDEHLHIYEYVINSFLELVCEKISKISIKDMEFHTIEEIK